MASRELHRFPDRGRCDECPARRWYLESGRRYCENGHQVEGYVQYEVDEDANFGRITRSVRKKKEARISIRKHLAGNEAKELYLQCIQFILRRQIAWLVNARGAHPELESVCHDLWELRVRGFIGLTRAGAAKDGGSKTDGGDGAKTLEGLDEGGESESDGMAVFSSQAESGASSTEGEGDDFMGHRMSRSRVKDWASENWPLPSMMDSLAILYLGCLMRGEPVRVGDIFRWAKTNQLPFLGAINAIPKDWGEHLPGWAHRALLTRYARFNGSELHHAVMDLMLNYQEHYELIFPSAPVAPLLLVWVKELALPDQVYRYAHELCSRLGLIFSFPTREAYRGLTKTEKYLLLDIPDVLLVASVIVATKYICPLDELERTPASQDDPLTLKMDWAAWNAEFPEPATKRAQVDFAKLTSDEVPSTGKDELHQYMDWFQQSQIHTTPLDPFHPYEAAIAKLFPLQEIPPPPAVHETPEEAILTRMRRIQAAMTSVAPQLKSPDRESDADQQQVYLLGDVYQGFKQVGELEGYAKAFYQVAAETAGLSLEDLVKAVYDLEKLMAAWQKREKQRLKEEDAGQEI